MSASGDTEGSAGSQDNAGALCQPDSIAGAAALELRPRTMLGDNDSYGLFAVPGGLVMGGSTSDKVKDVQSMIFYRRR